MKGEGAQQGLPARSWIALAVALALLNFLLTFRNVWPTPWIRPAGTLSVELALVLLVLALRARRFAVPPRWLTNSVAVVLVLLVLGRYASVTAPALYGRRINLYWDAQHIPAVAAMLAEAAPVWLVVIAAAVVVGLLGVLYAVMRWSIERVGAGLANTGFRRLVLALGAALPVLYFAGRASDALPTERWFAVPVSRTYAEQAGFLVDALTPDGGARSLPESPMVSSDLARVRETDVFVVFLESYGATAYDTPRFARVLAEGLHRLEATIGEAGLDVVSGFLWSPTFGSGSWRAHLSLLSGVEVGDERTYKLLLTTDRPTLVARFKAGGHRAVALMPGLKRAWPEGAFYGFDRIYGETDLDYRGPAFGWWRIPDQYALARLHDEEVLPMARQPLFVVFPTISSHAPFRPTPPFQPDWDRLLSDAPYGAEAVADALGRKPEWTDLGPAYADAMSYSLAMIAGYLRERGDRELVMVVLGDHQPPASVSGKDASWEVPVHVIASDPSILEALVEAGFGKGLTPRRPALGRIHELGPVLLSAVGSGEGAEAGKPPMLARAGRD